MKHMQKQPQFARSSRKTRRAFETASFQFYLFYFEIKSKIYSFNCSSCFNSNLEFQDGIILQIKTMKSMK